jgi:GNAT superfamily N-acetyltransferase
VPIGFAVTGIYDDNAIDALLRGNSAEVTPLTTPYWKDYDEYAGDRPTDWPGLFDLSRWTILAASIDNQRVGGAVVVHDDPQIELLRDCRGCAQLWDLRVDSAMRRHGVGSALLRSAEGVALRRGAHAMRVETQQINVPACRFYARNGFQLERVVRGAYHDLPDEIQLLWRKRLGGPTVDHPRGR